MLRNDKDSSLSADPSESDTVEGSGIHNYLRADISASAIRSNMGRLRNIVGDDVRICAVIKCNCYGHGQNLLLPIITETADWVAVATPAEALGIRESGYQGPVLVFFSTCTRMGEAGLAETLDALLYQQVTLSVSSRWELDILTTATRRTGREAQIHLCVDTGMTRAGISVDKAQSLIQEIGLDSALKMTGIYTHFATADEKDKERTIEQLRRFNRLIDQCNIGSDIIRHCANSAATIDLPETHMDMVRPGIAIYGYHPSDEMHNRPDLTPALKLTGHLMQVKDVPAGSGCGYGLTHTFENDSRAGLVPVGYDDGYLRSLSNVGAMRVGTSTARICGRVSMDQTVIDLTKLKDASVGDVVEIISPDPQAPNSVENLARLAGTIPYEIICRLGSRVRRFLVDTPDS